MSTSGQPDRRVGVALVAAIDDFMSWLLYGYETWLVAVLKGVPLFLYVYFLVAYVPNYIYYGVTQYIPFLKFSSALGFVIAAGAGGTNFAVLGVGMALAGPLEQLGGLVERRRHAVERHDAVNVGVLAVDHDERRVGQAGRGRRKAAEGPQRRRLRHRSSSQGLRRSMYPVDVDRSAVTPRRLSRTVAVARRYPVVWCLLPRAEVA